MMNIAALRYTPIARETKGGLPVEGSSIHPNMLEKLLSGGLGEDRIVKDAEDLRKEDAGQALLDKGFKREGDHQGKRVYALGEAHLYGNGQRALIGEDKSAQLVTFAERWIQFIEINAAGQVVRNSVQKLP